jgi:hypothetical protein
MGSKLDLCILGKSFQCLKQGFMAGHLHKNFLLGFETRSRCGNIILAGVKTGSVHSRKVLLGFEMEEDQLQH